MTDPRPRWRIRAGRSTRMMQAVARTLSATDGRVVVVAHTMQFARSHLLPMLPPEMRIRVDIVTLGSAHTARAQEHAGWFRDHSAFEHGAKPGDIAELLAVERRHQRRIQDRRR